MQTMVKVKAPAKINLFLEIHDKRSDGYHNIESIMQTVSLYDEITISLSQGNGIEICSNNELIPMDDANTAYKAAAMFYDVLHITKPHININIEKNIPICAGLGGGSADAAAVLLGLNSLYSHPLPMHDLLDIGKRVGADVPFCLSKGTAYVSGIGDAVHHVKPFPECVFIILLSGEKKSTATAYAELDMISRTNKVEIDNILNCLNRGDLIGCCQHYYNSFEFIMPIPLSIKNLFIDYGTLGMVLSGSGPSIISTFANIKNASVANELLRNLGYTTYVAKPVGN